MYLMRAEVPGPSVGKLVAKAKDTALILYSIYFALMVLMAVMLLFGGMNVYEAFTTALSTAGTGGFMVYDAGFIGFRRTFKRSRPCSCCCLLSTSTFIIIF